MFHSQRLVLLLVALCAIALCGCAAPAPTPTRAAAIGPARAQALDKATMAPTASRVPSGTPLPTEAPTPTVEPVKLSVFCAGSLMIPWFEIEAAYEKANPHVEVYIEPHGSIQCIRHVTDIHEEIDIVASADYRLLSLLMYNSMDPDTGEPYADWNIQFASNRLALAYDPQQVDKASITKENWVDLISQPGMRIGLADPRFDACGYRQLMLFQLAEQHYGAKRLFNNLLMGRFYQPITAERDDAGVLIHVPEILEPRKGSTIVMRGSSIQLIPLLQSGDVDYIVEYESVADQHGLAYVSLPDEVSLSDPSMGASYGQVRVKLDYRRFASVDPEFVSESIAYGVTIPSNAPHPEEAARFLAFCLGMKVVRSWNATTTPCKRPIPRTTSRVFPTRWPPWCKRDEDAQQGTPASQDWVLGRWLPLAE